MAAAQVHSTAILEGDVQLADDVAIGPGCVLTGPITIGAGTRLIGHVYGTGPLTMGPRNVVYPFTCLGFAPQHARFDPATPGRGLVIGEGNTFREHVTIHRAFTDEGPTRIGDRNYFMATSHAGHDVQIGSDCTFVNGALIGGHVTIEDRVLMGGAAAVHQFCRIGRGAMIGATHATSASVLPWFTLTGSNICGAVNLIGLRRNGFTAEQIEEVRWVFRTVYREGLSLQNAVERLKQRAESSVVAEYLRFIEASDRPICKGEGRSVRGTA